jgi:hypothetical protein
VIGITAAEIRDIGLGGVVLEVMARAAGVGARCCGGRRAILGAGRFIAATWAGTGPRVQGGVTEACAAAEAEMWVIAYRNGDRIRPGRPYPML